jgi:hypothetical protein
MAHNKGLFAMQNITEWTLPCVIEENAQQTPCHVFFSRCRAFSVHDEYASFGSVFRWFSYLIGLCRHLVNRGSWQPLGC